MHRHMAAEKLEKHRTDDERHCLTINIPEMLIECLLSWLVGMKLFLSVVYYHRSV